MIRTVICPFFSKEYACNAGIDYITLKDAREIVKVCLNNFRNCQNFILLSQKTSFNETKLYIKGRGNL